MQKELFPNWLETKNREQIERQAYELSQTTPKQTEAVGQPRPVIDVKNGIQIEMLKTGVKQ